MRSWHGRAAAVVVLVIGLAPALAADRPKDLIVGKWELAAKGLTFEFGRSGAVKMVSKSQGVDLAGKYRFVTDDTVEVTFDDDGQKLTDTFQIVAISRDTMVTVDGSKMQESLKRVK